LAELYGWEGGGEIHQVYYQRILDGSTSVIGASSPTDSNFVFCASQGLGVNSVTGMLILVRRLTTVMRKQFISVLLVSVMVLSGCFGNGNSEIIDDNPDDVIEPVYGCTDINGLNFDPNSDTDDGSCEYDTPSQNQSDIEAIVHFDQDYGQIAPIHGVNNGPLVRKAWELEDCQGLWYGANYTDKYNELQIPSSRTHGEGPGDMNRIWVHSNETGVPIYEGYDATNPANYNFSETDERISATMATTHTTVYWRMGYSKAFPSYTDCSDWRVPPDNFTVFAQAAVQVLKHYREGWNNGFYYSSFDVVEVWNEPYLDDWWSGTADQYFELYHEVNSAVTAEFGDSIDVVAGLQFSNNNGEFAERFLELAQANQEPIDAVYVHLYRSNPSQTLYTFFGNENNSIEATLARYGYPKNTPVYVTEWNRIIPIYAQTPASQSYLTSVLTIYNDLWQGNEGNTSYDGHTNLKMAHFFAARSFLWEENMNVKAPGITWEIYGDLYTKTPIRLFSEGGFHSYQLEADEFAVLAGKSADGKNVSVMLSRYVDPNGDTPTGFSNESDSVNLTIDGLEANCEYAWEHWAMTDNTTQPWQLLASGTFAGTEFELNNFDMNLRSFHYIKLINTNQC
jgi:hypothetical protein